MQPYKQFAPTPFDSRGAFLDDRDDWLVAPWSRTRDSGCLDESNFECALRELGGESEDVEVHRFGHWGPGWFEIIIIRPGSKAQETAQEMEDAFSDYPVVDEDDYSRREFEAACELWDNMNTRDRVEECQRARVSIFAARHDTVPGRILDSLRDSLS